MVAHVKFIFINEFIQKQQKQFYFHVRTLDSKLLVRRAQRRARRVATGYTQKWLASIRLRCCESK
jgi:hypothetical protein